MKTRSASNVSLSRLVFLSAFWVLASLPVAAQTGEKSVDENSGDEDDPTRPVRSFDMRYQFQDQSFTKQNNPQFLTPRLNYRLDFTPQWRVGLRFDLPITATDQKTADNPDGIYEIGFGRPLAQVFIARIIDDRWAVAIGSQIVSPALSGGDYGSKAWDALPGGAVRYMLPELGAGSYFVPLVKYDLSFANGPGSRQNSNLQFAPELKVGLPDTWFVELYPSADIRINFGDALPGQTGRLFLPIDAMVGRKLANGLLVSLEMGAPIVRDYPVYLLKIEARISVNF